MQIHDSFKPFFNKNQIKKEIDNIFSNIGLAIHKDSYLDIKYESKLDKYYFPCYEDVFRFASLDLNKAKYIILGMDPYPSYYIEDNKIKPIATGRSFEVANLNSWQQKTKQSSINNILKAIYFVKTGKAESIENIRKDISFLSNPHDWFDEMEDRGVIWLNATLTVKANVSDSHTDIWTNFMNELIKYIVDTNKNIKWLIFGEKAKNRVSDFVNKKDMYITCHPASRVNNTFVKDNLFQYIK